MSALAPRILPPGTAVILARVKSADFRGKRGVVVRYIKKRKVYRVRMTERIQSGTFDGSPWYLADGVTYEADAENLDPESRKETHAKQ